MTPYLFVYGTLKKGFTNDYAQYLHSNSSFVSTGFFHGLLYNVGGYPGALFSGGGQEKVFGEVFKLNQAEMIFTKLDGYEEIDLNSATSEYTRKVIPVYSNKERIDCWVYLYNQPIDDFDLIPSGNYQL